MKIVLNLLENSHDYLQESVRYFVIADEFGTHEEKSSSYSNKIKWKMAYVTLVQAFELLVKELLKSIAPILIYDDIDKPINNNSKTVSGTKGVDRLHNCEVKIMSKDIVGFVKECIAKREKYLKQDEEQECMGDYENCEHNELLVVAQKLKELLYELNGGT